MPPETRNQRFERYLSEEAYQAAWRYSLYLEQSLADAEDLLQDALVRACKGLGSLRSEDRFTGWLLSIVRTVFLDGLRRKRRPTQATEPLPLFLAAESADPLAATVADALLSLPESQRDLLTLFYLEGLSLSETGQVLGLAPIAVRQRLFRARRALRRAMSRLDESAGKLACPSQK